MIVMNSMNIFLGRIIKKAIEKLKRFSDAFSRCIPLCRVRKSFILKYIRFLYPFQSSGLSLRHAHSRYIHWVLQYLLKVINRTTSFQRPLFCFLYRDFYKVPLALLRRYFYINRR